MNRALAVACVSFFSTVLGADHDHWAFNVPNRPVLPEVSDQQWIRSPIDRFVLAALEAEGIGPAPEASKVGLIRRLHLDLTGLLPTPEEVDAFVADRRDEAYSELVDRLLDSPHYGERWGRHWLDAARYADSDGFEKDKQRWVWFYRDWVVNALNEDMPYDRFIVEQIAGDLLPNPTQDQFVATGFLRNSMINEEGGVDPEQFRMEAMFDRMDAIGKGILGLTIQCAQCHEHKYDPISQEEYYQMFAFINNAHESNVSVYSPSEQRKRSEIFRKIDDIEADLRHRHSDWPEQMRAWEKSLTEDVPNWTVLNVVNAGDNSQRYTPQEDGSLLVGGYAPTKFTATFTNVVDLPEIRAFRLELLTDPNLPGGGPGRSIQGLFGLTEFKVELADATDPTNQFSVKFDRATSDFGNEESELDRRFDDQSGKRRVTGPVEYAIDNNNLTAWGIDAGPGRRNIDRKAVFSVRTNVAFLKGTKISVNLVQMHGGWNSDDNQNMNLGRFRVSVTGSKDAVADPLPARLRRIVGIPQEQRTSDQQLALFRYWRTTVPEFDNANRAIEALWAQHPEGTMQLVLSERGVNRDTQMLKRGDWLNPGKTVQAGVPEMLHDLPENVERNRLTFAKWLASKESPTTARAMVNRVWQAYFGTGLVSTSEDLGVRAEAPSHPELLDWLAVEFMDRGWHLKELHRMIVRSATYRQSSHVDPETIRRDPLNRQLARGARFRVEGEIVRDIALAASGLLDRTVGGPGVYPPAPDYLFLPPASYGPKVWHEAKGSDRYRRGLYTFRYRSVPYPVLETFDTPNGDFSCVRRERSNSPLQALTTLNEPLFVECSQALARMTLEQGGETDIERVVYAFRRCLSRAPSPKEVAMLMKLLETQSQYISEGWVNASELATGEPELTGPLPEGTTPVRLAAWTTVSRVLLNLDETITKE